MATFVPNPAFEPALVRSAGVAQWLSGIIADAEANAVALAPERLGILKADIHGDVFVDPDRGSLVARLSSDDFKTLWAEFGTVELPPRPFLRPAAEQAAPGADWDFGKGR